MTDIAEIRKLSVPERLQLVGEIWDSILDAPELLPVSDELADELQKRLDAHRASPQSSESWKSVDRSKKYDTVVASGQSALRALLTIDGGAIIVLLTFFGHMWDKGKGTIPPQSGQLFAWAVLWFIAAIFFALLSYGSIFVSNVLSMKNWHKASDRAFIATFISGIVSLGCFVGGAVTAFLSVTTLLSP